jgi:hypothetical protein
LISVCSALVFLATTDALTLEAIPQARPKAKAMDHPIRGLILPSS